MRRLIIAVLCLVGGCAQQEVNTRSMRGRPLHAVIAANSLDRYHSWPVMNLPAGTEQGITYFLNRGNLRLWYAGDPPVVRKAEYWPSPESAAARFQQADAGWDAWVKAHARTTDTPSAAKREVRPGMTKTEAEAALQRLFPTHSEWWRSAGVGPAGEAICEYYQVDPDTTVVLRYRADTDINIPDTEKITEVEVNRFEDLRKEIPPDLYEHVRLLHHLPGCQATRYDPAALIRVINDLQPLGKQKALEVLRTYERLAGDEILAMKEQWKEGEDARRSARARRYGITTHDWRLLPIPGLLFVQEDGTPIPVRSFGQASATDHPGGWKVFVSDDIPFIPEFIVGIGGQAPNIENEMAPFGKTMRIRPTPLSPKGDPLTAAESLLQSPQWKRFVRTKDETARQNLQEMGANRIRMQAIRMLGTRVPGELPAEHEANAVAVLWQRCLNDPALRTARWNPRTQAVEWPATAGH